MKGEQDIFCAALEQTSHTRRATFLEQACGPRTRGRIESLLRAASAAGGFLTDEDAPVGESAGSWIGRYRLGDPIGEGGFGIVYLAAQEQPVRREVALKIIKLGMDTRAVVARFEAERQALAMMDHPNIARVFDGGATEAGRPYFVMELVRGVPITTYSSEQRLRLAERLALFLQVCRAVQHAHQKGIIHRDLKPSNILITRVGDEAVAKVIDFGIAKATREPLTEKTLLTRQHTFVGTPAYMSPEQVSGGDVDVDTRSDIYSLGALLYELLSDFPLLDARVMRSAGYAEIQRAICAGEPPAPSQRVAALAPSDKLAVAQRRQCAPERLAAALRGDLDRIVLKCLEKDRTRRYQTAEDLARDVTRFLHDEPVHARPATLGYRASKFFRRHRRIVFAAMTGVALLASFGVYHTRRLAGERDRARLEAQKAAKVSELLTELLIAGDPFRTPTPQGILEASAARVRQDFAAQPDVRAEILNAVGRVYLRRGEHDKAEPILTEALAAADALGRPDLRLAQSLSHLGVLRTECGNPAGAVPLLTRALALRRQLLGNDHNDIAISLVELGRAYFAMDRFNLAEPLFRESLAIRRKVLGNEHREVAVSLGALAQLHWHKGEFDVAEPLFEQSLAMHRQTVGADHPNAGQAMANLALLKIDQNELATAETLLRDAVTIMRRSFGEQNWRTARVRGHLGAVWRKQGRLEEAAATLDEALAVTRATPGAGRPLLAALAVERARVHLDAGEPAAAEPLLREALRVQRLTLPEDGWRIASTKSLLAAALVGLSRVAEAKPLLIDADRHLYDIPGPQGSEARPTHERLAAVQRNGMRF